MSIKCGKCDNRVFDSNAYLKISVIEREHQEKIERLTEELNQAKSKYGKKSDLAQGIQWDINVEKLILKVIQRCKNVL